MISTSDLALQATASSVDAAVPRQGDRRLALGWLLLGTAFVLGCVAVIMSALASNSPPRAGTVAPGDPLVVLILATSILLAAVGLASTICGLFASRSAAR